MDALALRADEGRVGCDPRISEWGNLAHLHGELPPAECIGWLGGTRGSETSQYPQEEKIK